MPRQKRKSSASGAAASSTATASASSGPQEDDLSLYERLRLQNLARNKAELRRLGLEVERLTIPATGRQAPTAATARQRAVPPRTRWSARLLGQAVPDYTGERIDNMLGDGEPAAKRRRKKAAPKRKQQAGTKPRAVPTKPTNPRSCKNLRVDVAHLRENWLGKIIPPLGGQVKRAVMEEASAQGSPKFSRMSGIQEWRNAVLLFVNVYGDGYKNVFLDDGRSITWFAQSRQWEGTPVIQRLINCAGGVDSEGNKVRQTPVFLFCRNLGQGYVCCGQLAYMGHDPDRIPVRFVWELRDFDHLNDCEPFRALVDECNRMFE